MPHTYRTAAHVLAPVVAVLGLLSFAAGIAAFVCPTLEAAGPICGITAFVALLAAWALDVLSSREGAGGRR